MSYAFHLHRDASDDLLSDRGFLEAFGRALRQADPQKRPLGMRRIRDMEKDLKERIGELEAEI